MQKAVVLQFPLSHMPVAVDLFPSAFLECALHLTTSLATMPSSTYDYSTGKTFVSFAFTSIQSLTSIFKKWLLRITACRVACSMLWLCKQHPGVLRLECCYAFAGAAINQSSIFACGLFECGQASFHLKRVCVAVSCCRTWQLAIGKRIMAQSFQRVMA